MRHFLNLREPNSSVSFFTFIDCACLMTQVKIMLYKNKKNAN